MPSFVIGCRSGGDQVLSGCSWSGQLAKPQGGIRLKVERSTTFSGNIYIGLSGGVTITSGLHFLSGTGNMDGYPIGPGDELFIPRSATGLSGTINVFATTLATGSGIARLYYEVY